MFVDTGHLPVQDTGRRTVIGTQIRGDEPHAGVVSRFGETITPTLLDLVQPPKDGVQAILIVEGYTDKADIEAALAAAGRAELLEGLEIRYDGADKAAVQAILIRQMLSGRFRSACSSARMNSGNRREIS